jgi:hypothetical protein
MKMAGERGGSPVMSAGPRRTPRLEALRAALSDRKNQGLLVFAGVFLIAYWVPFGDPRVSGAVNEGFAMLGEYARQHVLLCLVPAFFIAGAITMFLSQQSVIRYLGPGAAKPVAYGVAAASGTILAVCSCTVLPMFKGIYRKGAGLGPAVSFLYSGPAINVLAIVLTAKVLGPELGLARTAGAILFAVVIGFAMHVIYRKEDLERVTNAAMFEGPASTGGRSLGQTSLAMAGMVGILVFVNWAPSVGAAPAWDLVYRGKYLIAAGFAALLAYALVRWFQRSELRDWMTATRDFAAQILPLLFGGVLVAGFLLGRPDHGALIPAGWIAGLVGGNGLAANLLASVFGVLMYFATLTEIPILQGLLGAGMGKGPALALLLSGPSLSLPSILVIASELGWPKTLTYVGLVVLLSTLAGLAFGAFA